MKIHSGEKSNKCNQCDFASFQARVREVLFFWQKKVLFFAKKSNFFLQKKVLFFVKKSTFFYKKKLLFFAKKSTFFVKKKSFFQQQKNSFYLQKNTNFCFNTSLEINLWFPILLKDLQYYHQG